MAASKFSFYNYDSFRPIFGQASHRVMPQAHFCFRNRFHLKDSTRKHFDRHSALPLALQAYTSLRSKMSSSDQGSLLKGKSVLLTGASRGIGRAIAEAYARNGARCAPPLSAVHLGNQVPKSKHTHQHDKDTDHTSCYLWFVCWEDHILFLECGDGCAGARLYVVARTTEKLEEVKESCEKLGSPEVTIIEADMLTEDDLAKIAQEASSIS